MWIKQQMPESRRSIGESKVFSVLMKTGCGLKLFSLEECIPTTLSCSECVKAEVVRRVCQPFLFHIRLFVYACKGQLFPQ